MPHRDVTCVMLVFLSRIVALLREAGKFMNPSGRTSIATIAALAVLIYWGVLFLGTHLPGGSQLPFTWFDKVQHASAFAMLALLLLTAISLRVRAGWIAALTVIGICAVYGLVDELSQQLVPRRTCDFYDWVADVTGSLIGCGIFFAARAAWAMLRATHSPTT